jgi:hypothetical protein
MEEKSALNLHVIYKENFTPVSKVTGTAGSPTSITFSLSVPVYQPDYPQLVPVQK